MKKIKKTGNAMQQPMDSYINGINTSLESIFIKSDDKKRSCPILVHLFYAKSISDKRRELSDLKFIPQT